VALSSKKYSILRAVLTIAKEILKTKIKVENMLNDSLMKNKGDLKWTN